MPDIPYERMDSFKRYMSRRGVAVYDGEKGADALRKMGHDDALGMFIVMANPKNPSGPPITGFVFKGQPNRAIVHHELWHRQDFVKNFGGSFERWRKANEGTGVFARERYVTQRMTGTGTADTARGAERWGSYRANERANQLLYDHQNAQAEAMMQFESIVESLGSMGVK
jgi:hypothetical protein